MTQTRIWYLGNDIGCKSGIRKMTVNTSVTLVFLVGAFVLFMLQVLLLLLSLILQLVAIVVMHYAMLLL